MPSNVPTSSPLSLQTRADVASLLGVDLSKLTYLLIVLTSDRRYKTFEIQRRNGTTPRIIRAPIPPLMAIQRSLLVALLPYYRPPHAVHGYVQERSIVTKARVHRRQTWVLRVDLQGFFPSINFGRVRGLFLKPPFSFPAEAATTLAQICCCNNELPQGAPTSPLISNIICRGLDRKLAKLAVSERCYYTRYCDDLVFSSSRRSFPQGLAGIDPHSGTVLVGPRLAEAVLESGFQINAGKTILRKRTQRQMVTGLVTNAGVNVPRDYVRSLRSLLYAWRHHGEGAAEECLARHHPKNRPPGKAKPSFKLVIRGKVQHVGAIKGWGDPVYGWLASRLKALDPTFEPTRRVVDSPPTILRVLVEGVTDYLHLRFAIRRFHEQGEFKDLDLDFGTLPAKGKGGHDELKRTCEIMCRLAQVPPVVGIFDRDNEPILSEVTVAGKPFKDWGNNVFSVAIPHPAHRPNNEPICIELLYDDQTLNLRDPNSRKIYLRKEFDAESGRHLTEQVYCTTPRSDSLIRDDNVFDFVTKAKVSMSKRSFADAVTEGRDPYTDVSVEGFRGLFGTLRAIRMHLLGVK